MSEIRNTKILFDETSIHATDYSLNFFSFRDQATITSVGLGPDDVITFETVLLKSGTPDEFCGCFVAPGKMPTIAGTEALMCFECGDGEEPQPVRLTASNPIVVLNAPQGVLMRAHFSGPSLGTAEVWATLGTDTTHLLPGMDGCPGECCIDTEWFPTGVSSCDLEEDLLHVQEQSNCGTIRWVEAGELNWQDTGLTRCVEHVEEVQQVNDCGDLRWEPTENSCGWIPTYELPCGGLAFRPEDDRDPEATVEIDGCGGDPVAYLYPEPRPWATKPITDCEGCEEGGEVIGYAFEDGRAGCDPCQGDPGAWVRTGVRRNAGPASSTQYFVERQEVNGCGHFDWKPDGMLPWEDTGNTRCAGDVIQRQQSTEFGQTRWVFDRENTWVETGAERCANHLVERQEVDSCGNLRWTASTIGCGYLPTYPLPCGGLAFRPTDLRDPEATAPLEDCEGDVIAYIYPTPREGASTPVTDCQTCEDGETLFGYATNGDPLNQCFNQPDATAVAVFEKNGQQFILWTNGATTRA